MQPLSPLTISLAQTPTTPTQIKTPPGFEVVSGCKRPTIRGPIETAKGPFCVTIRADSVEELNSLLDKIPLLIKIQNAANPFLDEIVNTFWKQTTTKLVLKDIATKDPNPFEKTKLERTDSSRTNVVDTINEGGLEKRIDPRDVNKLISDIFNRVITNPAPDPLSPVVQSPAESQHSHQTGSPVVANIGLVHTPAQVQVPNAQAHPGGVTILPSPTPHEKVVPASGLPSHQQATVPTATVSTPPSLGPIYPPESNAGKAQKLIEESFPLHYSTAEITLLAQSIRIKMNQIKSANPTQQKALIKELREMLNTKAELEKVQAEVHLNKIAENLRSKLQNFNEPAGGKTVATMVKNGAKLSELDKVYDKLLDASKKLDAGKKPNEAQMKNLLWLMESLRVQNSPNPLEGYAKMLKTMFYSDSQPPSFHDLPEVDHRIAREVIDSIQDLEFIAAMEKATTQPSTLEIERFALPSLLEKWEKVQSEAGQFQIKLKHPSPGNDLSYVKGKLISESSPLSHTDEAAKKEWEVLRQRANTGKDAEAAYLMGHALIDGKYKGKHLFTPSPVNLNDGVIFLMVAERLGDHRATECLNAMHIDKLMSTKGELLDRTGPLGAIESNRVINIEIPHQFTPSGLAEQAKKISDTLVLLEQLKSDDEQTIELREKLADDMEKAKGAGFQALKDALTVRKEELEKVAPRDKQQNEELQEIVKLLKQIPKDVRGINSPYILYAKIIELDKVQSPQHKDALMKLIIKLNFFSSIDNHMANSTHKMSVHHINRWVYNNEKYRNYLTAYHQIYLDRMQAIEDPQRSQLTTPPLSLPDSSSVPNCPDSLKHSSIQTDIQSIQREYMRILRDKGSDILSLDHIGNIKINPGEALVSSEDVTAKPKKLLNKELNAVKIKIENSKKECLEYFKHQIGLQMEKLPKQYNDKELDKRQEALKKKTPLNDVDKKELEAIDRIKMLKSLIESVEKRKNHYEAFAEYLEQYAKSDGSEPSTDYIKELRFLAGITSDTTSGKSLLKQSWEDQYLRTYPPLAAAAPAANPSQAAA